MVYIHKQSWIGIMRMNFRNFLEDHTEILRNEKEVILLRDERPDGEGTGTLYFSTGKTKNQGRRGDLVLLIQAEYNPATKTLTLGSKGKRIGMFDGWKPVDIVSHLTSMPVKVAIEHHL